MSSKRPSPAAFTKDLARVEVIINSMPAPVLIVDEVGTIIAANRLVENLFGHDRTHLLGEAIDVLIPRNAEAALFAPSGAPATIAKKQRADAHLFLRGLRRDGHELPIEVQLQPLDLGGTPVSVVSIDDRTIDEANAGLESFAYTASHDLQAPLRSITGFAQLLQDRYADVIDERASHWIHQIVESTSHMQALVHDLLNYSKLESGRLPLEEVSLATLVDGVVAILEPEIKDTQAEVTHGPLPTKRVDVPQMRQLLQNLIHNGLKYRGEGPARVHLECVENEREWVLSVRDHGIGIAPEHHEEVFDAFRRLHTQDEFPGSGIGLAVVRRVAKRHGGRVWLESTPGKGSTFYVAIPNDPTGAKP